MKKKLLFLTSLVCLLTTGCTVSHASNPGDTDPSQPITELKTNYQRMTDVQKIVGEMSEKIVNSPGDKKGKVTPHNKNNGQFEYHDWMVQEIEEPDVKILNEPLSLTFAILEYFIQNGEPNYPIFDKTFYTSATINGETQYLEYFKIRDYPTSGEKMLYIQYWGGYHNLIHMDDNGHFSMITESPMGRHSPMLVDDEMVGNGEDFMVQLCVQADGYNFSTLFVTSDYGKDIPGIIEHFHNNFAGYETEENTFKTSKMLLQAYFDLYKQEDGTYDRSDLLNPNPTELGEDDVLIDEQVSDITSYLSIHILQDAFMYINYVEAVSNNTWEFYEFEDSTLLKVNTLCSIYKIPEFITEIDGLLTDPDGVGDNPYFSGCAVYIPSTVNVIKEGALNNSKSQHISHIFVDFAKEECPFADVLDQLEGVVILYKDEYIILDNLPVPKAPHDLGEQQDEELVNEDELEGKEE